MADPILEKCPHCDIHTNFANVFGNWRLKNNIPLKKIAEELGVSISTVNSWELGKRFPTGSHFEKIVDYTGLPPCRLCCPMADKCIPAECPMAFGKKS